MSVWEKIYNRINWKNKPSTDTPIHALNLNRGDEALNILDDRVIELNTVKAEQSNLLQCVKNITYDTNTGIFVFTWWNGSSLTVDLNIEKIPVSFRIDEQGIITLTNTDGTTSTANVANLIKTYSFSDSSDINFFVTTDEDGNKTVTAGVGNGSITEDKLQPNYLADITTQATNARASAVSASNSASDALADAKLAESYAVGNEIVREGSSTDNAKYYKEQAQQAASTFVIDSALSSTSENPVQNKVIKTEIDTLKNYVGDGKELVADAITDKGVQTAADATFAVMATNIAAINSGGVNINNPKEIYEYLIDNKLIYEVDGNNLDSISVSDSVSGPIDTLRIVPLSEAASYLSDKKIYVVPIKQNNNQSYRIFIFSNDIAKSLGNDGQYFDISNDASMYIYNKPFIVPTDENIHFYTQISPLSPSADTSFEIFKKNSEKVNVVFGDVVLTNSCMPWLLTALKSKSLTYFKDLQYDYNNDPPEQDIEHYRNIPVYGDATDFDVLNDKKYTTDTGIKRIGTMPNNGAVSPTALAAGESYTIPAGYHNGNGVVNTKSLASQTDATAYKYDIVDGKTAWVHGEKLNGTIKRVYGIFHWGPNVDNSMRYLIVNDEDDWDYTYYDAFYKDPIYLYDFNSRGYEITTGIYHSNRYKNRLKNNSNETITSFALYDEISLRNTYHSTHHFALHAKFYVHSGSLADRDFGGRIYLGVGDASNSSFNLDLVEQLMNYGYREYNIYDEGEGEGEIIVYFSVPYQGSGFDTKYTKCRVFIGLKHAIDVEFYSIDIYRVL